MRRRHAVAIALAAVALATGAFAQRQPLPPPGGIAGDSEAPEFAWAVELEGLLRLPGADVDIHYPPDQLDRAARLQMRLEALRAAWKGMTRSPLAWRAALVGRSRWARLAPGAPWGLPTHLPGGLFLLPVHADDAVVARVSELVGGPPPEPAGEPVTGSREAAGALVVVDLLLQLEAARAVADAARWRGDEPWIRDLLVHVALRYAWETREPASVLPNVQLFDRIAAAQGGPRARPLAELRPGLPPAIDLWYQAQMVRGADVVWVDHGRYGVARLLDRWADRDRPVRRAELEKRFPALVDWQRSAFAP